MTEYDLALQATDQRLEQLRRRARRMEQMMYAGVLMFVGSGVMVVADEMLLHWDIAIFLCLLLAPLGIIMVMGSLLGGWLVSRAEKKVTAAYAPAVLARVMDRLDWYDHREQIDRNYLDANFGFPYYDRVDKHGDYVRGVFRGIPLEFGEFGLEEGEWVRDSDGEEHKQYVTVFAGILVVCHHGLLLGSDVAVTQYSTPRDRRMTGDPGFDDAFSLLEGDERDVELAFPPHYRAQLTQLSMERGKKFALRFRRDGKLLIVLRGWDLFELGESKNTGELMDKLERELMDFGDVLTILGSPAREGVRPAAGSGPQGTPCG